MSTIQEIADYAKVSSATVSRVINDSGYVKDETRAKVEEAIQQFNYTPNRHAQHLRKGAAKNLGIVSSSFNDTANARIKPFIELARKAGYTTTLFITNGESKRELDAFDMLKSKQLDGIFLIYRANDWKIVEQYTQYGPIVTLHNLESSVISSVFIDHYDAYTMTLDHLWERDSRRILNIYGTDYGLNTQRRMEAYKDFCKDHNITPYQPESFINIFTLSDVEKIVDWFSHLKEKPDAIIAYSDTIAAYLVSHLRRRGYQIPEDLSIIGFDNLAISDLMDITTIDYTIDEQGKNACRLLLNTLEEKNLDLHPLTFKLVKRKTTK